MAESKTKQTEREEAEKSPVVWLAVHEAAVLRGNAALVNRARRELAKRGVVIRPAAEGGTR